MYAVYCILYIVCGLLAQDYYEVREAAFGSPNIVRDLPLGEGWDSCGNDLSKIANDVSTATFERKRRKGAMDKTVIVMGV